MRKPTEPTKPIKPEKYLHRPNKIRVEVLSLSKDTLKNILTNDSRFMRKMRKHNPDFSVDDVKISDVEISDRIYSTDISVKTSDRLLGPKKEDPKYEEKLKKYSERLKKYEQKLMDYEENLKQYEQYKKISR